MVSFLVPLIGLGALLAEFSNQANSFWKPKDDRIWFLGAVMPLMFYSMHEYNKFYRLTQTVLTVETACLSFMSYEGDKGLGLVAAALLLLAYQGFSCRADDLIPGVSYYGLSLGLLSIVNLVVTFGCDENVNYFQITKLIPTVVEKLLVTNKVGFVSG
jgi:hypothetical protein